MQKKKDLLDDASKSLPTELTRLENGIPVDPMDINTEEFDQKLGNILMEWAKADETNEVKFVDINQRIIKRATKYTPQENPKS